MTCQGISLGLVSIGCCFFLSVTRRGGFYLFFTRSVSEITDFLCPEFSNLFLHTENRGIIFFITNYRIIEYLSHGMSRRSRIFFVPRLVLGPTDRREVIREFFLHTDCRGIIFFITNYRIIEYLSHGMSRKVTDFFVPRLVLGPTDQREVICEFANFFSSHGESRRSRIFFCPETCPWTH